MRARNLKPGFFKNEDLADCEPLARILFCGLWCMADREGRLGLRPRKIKAELLPYDNCSIPKLLKQLCDKGFIFIYVVNDNEYIQIIKFKDHQNPHIREVQSTIPAPDEHQTSTEPARLIPSSLNLIPLTLYKHAFEKFWKIYPKKTSKKGALEQWEIASKNKTLPEIDFIINALQNQIQAKQKAQSAGQFVSEWPDPERWIKKARWDDDIQTMSGNNGNQPSSKPKHEEKKYYCPHCKRTYEKELVDGYCENCLPRKTPWEVKMLTSGIGDISRPQPDEEYVNPDDVPL
ncbi:MAG TPA: hypothetical protein DCR95_09255 [Desulfobacter sp.]|nr:hypothetical protein [Desulfobacter sp.]